MNVCQWLLGCCQVIVIVFYVDARVLPGGCYSVLLAAMMLLMVMCVAV